MIHQPSLWPAIRILVDDEPQYVALIAAMVQAFDRGRFQPAIPDQAPTDLGGR